MDFFQICTKEARGGVIEVFPDFTVGRSTDLMVRGQSFYAIWDAQRNMWSTDEYDVQRLVDEALHEYVEKLKADGVACSAKYLRSYGTNGWNQFRKFMKNVSDNSHQLDMTPTFANTVVKKSDYVSRRLPYALERGDISAYDELVSLLYAPEERAKFEWAIGSIIAGDSKKIEKFLVFYGAAGTGKSTVMKIIQELFQGYIANFEAKALVGNNNAFATEVFKHNPLVAIQHDGDLSRVEDNSKLNSIVSHEPMQINEKYKSGYSSTINAFLFMGTNKSVKITDAKSGLIRRLIDVKPTNMLHSPRHYEALMARVHFELGAIAHHCLDVYRQMGKNFYSDYRPTEMMLLTDPFYNFVESYYDIFKEQDGTTLKQAYTLYKEYCVEAQLEYKMVMYKFREELKNYFEEFHNRITVDGVQMHKYYRGFKLNPYKAPDEVGGTTFSLVLDETESPLDAELAKQPAQYAKKDGTPQKRWSSVTTVLDDVDTTQLHFVKLPENHIVIDFDLTGDDGEKSREANEIAASDWPPTYAEYSKSGNGVHLHYIYPGNPLELASVYSEGIEIKVFTGDASLRRKLTKCNNLAVATIPGGLPFKEKKMLQSNTIQSEKGLRDLIARNLNKEIHPGTKPSIDFIKKILDDAYESGMVYDVTDLRTKIAVFANKSSHQSLACMKTLTQMKFKSDESAVEKPDANDTPKSGSRNDDSPVVFFDVEVYPNLFVVCWKYHGDKTVSRMIEPTPQEIENLFRFKLVGFNNRGYDNHILWGRFMGKDTGELYELSQKIIGNVKGATFGEAYNVSYADIYDFVTKKQTLKKWQIELGLPHKEMDLPWDQPVPKDRIMEILDYCCNDVNANEAVFDNCKQDFVARQILADLSGLSVNDPTRKHSAKIIFGDDREPQKKFVDTDLSKQFKGYSFDEFSKDKKSIYRGEVVGEGGYVYAEPGIYHNVALLDVASMHPTSIECLNLFGDEYTAKFVEIKNARLAIKRADEAIQNDDWVKVEKILIDEVGRMLDTKLLPYVKNTSPDTKGDLEDLSDALKLVINSIYGYTMTPFENPFRDMRNKDNVVAKRGALFMIDLKHAVQEKGFTVAHIKTDSIKIPDATPEIIEFVKEFGKKYGYTFEHEATYDKFCLVNDAVFIAYVGWNAKRKPSHWKAVGAQFQHPYVFKSLFSNEPITFDDMCETKSVQKGALYLDFDETDGTPNEPHDGMKFIGKVGRFVPVTKSTRGASLLRVNDNRIYAVTGTKGFLWLEADTVKILGNDGDEVTDFNPHISPYVGDFELDMEYYQGLLHDAEKAINKHGSFAEFVA